MRQFKRTAISGAVAQALLFGAGVVHAQATSESSEPATLAPVAVTGQRAALQSAQKLKQNAEEIVDSVVAEEAGKLPDRSITEVLQRVVGVTMNRNRGRGDPEHFAVEGGGISVRGLTWGASNLNGREMFSAGWPGRELSWADVPPELMAGVDVYKNPSAERIEGGVSGLVDLRTWLPFDFKGTKQFITVQGQLRRTEPEGIARRVGPVHDAVGRGVGPLGCAGRPRLQPHARPEPGAAGRRVLPAHRRGRARGQDRLGSRVGVLAREHRRHRANRPVRRAAVEEERHAVGADLLRGGHEQPRDRGGAVLEQRGSLQEPDHERRVRLKRRVPVGHAEHAQRRPRGEQLCRRRPDVRHQPRVHREHLAKRRTGVELQVAHQRPLVGAERRAMGALHLRQPERQRLPAHLRAEHERRRQRHGAGAHLVR